MNNSTECLQHKLVHKFNRDNAIVTGTHNVQLNVKTRVFFHSKFCLLTVSYILNKVTTYYFIVEVLR